MQKAQKSCPTHQPDRSYKVPKAHDTFLTYSEQTRREYSKKDWHKTANMRIMPILYRYLYIKQLSFYLEKKRKVLLQKHWYCNVISTLSPHNINDIALQKSRYHAEKTTLSHTASMTFSSKSTQSVTFSHQNLVRKPNKGMRDEMIM